MKKYTIYFQLDPLHMHRHNAAERAIRTCKDHFISGIAMTDPYLPISKWDQLIPQCLIPLNLLLNYKLVPYQDFPYAIILWYVLKIIYLSQEQDHFSIKSSNLFFDLISLILRAFIVRYQYYINDTYLQYNVQRGETGRKIHVRSTSRIGPIPTKQELFFLCTR